MSKYYTLVDFQKDFPNDDVCLETIFQVRYGKLQFCPHCGAETTFYKLKKKKAYACKQPHCGFTLSPTAGMIFDHSPTPLTKWFYALYLFSVAKNGVSAMELQRHLGVTYKCAWRMCQQIRWLMQQSGAPLTGTIEIDETYIGGKHQGNPGKFDNKIAVIGMVEKQKGTGQIKAMTTKRADASVALPFIRAMARQGTKVQTDESRIYHRVKRDFEHAFINHSKEEYSKDGISTNTIEGFWSQMKRSIDGTYHCVSPKYLQLYVNEFVYRYNLRDQVIGPHLLERAWSQPLKPIRQK
jgi:ISXO2 transposase-like protein/transposase-like zinc ribbon protein